MIHEVSRERCLFSHRQIGRSGGYQQETSLFRSGLRTGHNYRVGKLVELCFGSGLGHRLKCLVVRLGHQYRVTPALQRRHDFSHLGGRLTFTQHHLGPAGAQGPVVIDLGKTQVLIRQVTQLAERFIDTQPVLFEFLQ